ncbi:MAG: lytic murein transglycosylase [Nocardioides sp.]|uniref:lytic murein transglycosylase n=1 Tax=Nocardioides sp. TaxID=35761 RepID=UPI0039E6D8F9
MTPEAPADKPFEPRPSEPFRIGIVPKLLTAVPLAALCVTGLLVRVHQPVQATVTSSAESADASESADATAETTTEATDDPALQVETTDDGSATVDTATSTTSGAVVTAAGAWSDLPAAAQAAYQRAATVIDSADPSCQLDWTVLAAIGKIESDHGRSGGTTLDANGVATPAIVGPALTGADGTTAVADTDGGSLDGDATWDHAVGPMQFLPATWTVVGVDADGDGQRNANDIDDAALAAAVYLCSGSEDLATTAGKEAAVYRYNHSTSYVSSVLATATAYQTGFGSADGSVATALLDARAVTQVSDTTASTTSSSSTTSAKKTATKSLASSASTSSTAATGSTATSTAVAASPIAVETATAATTDDLIALATETLASTFPDATDAASAQALAALVEALTGKTLAEATAAIGDLAAALPDTIEGLVPSEEPSEAPSAEPSENTTSASTEDASGQQSGEKSGAADTKTAASDATASATPTAETTAAAATAADPAAPSS